MVKVNNHKNLKNLLRGLKNNSLKGLSNTDELELLELEADALDFDLKLDEEKDLYPERNGNISADDLKKTFGFRYINIDINLDEKDEQQMLNMSYDTFLNLARVISKPTIAIGLGRNLTLNIGIVQMGFRTGGSYRPSRRSLNFKAQNDFKHIAHEWLHAFDHYLSYTFGLSKNELMSDKPYWNEPHSQLTEKRFGELLKAIKDSDYIDLSGKCAKMAMDNYWAEWCEMLARAFEIYTDDIMSRLNIKDERLVSLFKNNPYPDKENPKDKPILYAFKQLFDGLEIKKMYDTESLYGIY